MGHRGTACGFVYLYVDILEDCSLLRPDTWVSRAHCETNENEIELKL